MSNIVQSLKTYYEKFDQELSKQSFLVKLEGQTGIAKANLVIGAAILLIVFMSFNSLALMLTNIVGLAVPAYFALHSCKEQQPVLNSMLYFMFFSALMLLENLMPGVTSVIPMYPFVKIGFLGWLCSPKHQGALFLMNHFGKNFCPGFPVEVKRSASAVNVPSSQFSSKLSTSLNSALLTPLNKD